MKHLLTLTATFIIGIFSINAQSIEQCKKTIDSLSKKYNKKVVGYHKSITINPIPRETFIYYYIDEKGEMQNEQAWAQLLKSKEVQSDYNSLPTSATSVYYNNNYIGYIRKGYFTKVIYPTMSLEIRNFLNTKEKLDTYLTGMFGKYYIETIN